MWDGLLLIALAVAGQGSSASTELQRLAGVWSYALVEVEGERQPDVPFATHKLVFLPDGRYVIRQGERITRGRVRLDPTRTPGHYEVEVESGAQAGLVTLGIYELSTERLTICLSLRPDDRPAEFATGAGSGRLLFVLSRQANEVEATLAEIARVEGGDVPSD